MTRVLRALVIVALAATGCSYTHLYGERLGGVQFDRARAIRVERHPDDERDIAGLIGERLVRAGFRVAHAAEVAPETEQAQAIVSYEDHWMWDMSMYLLTLRIDFRDPRTNELRASGQSYRTSLDRVEPQVMVNEVVDKILDGN